MFAADRATLPGTPFTGVPGTVLLAGIVGSTAYGLAHAGSDVDRLGMFAAPTSAFHGLGGPQESHVTKAPDSTAHEAAKYCRLALSCNPTVSELLWLPDSLYDVRTPLGDELIRLRTAFLSRGYVRDAYLGYARQQWRKLAARGDGSFSADTRRRTEKHARHLHRLLIQGEQLYTTGELTVRVPDPDSLRKRAAYTLENPNRGAAFLDAVADRMDRAGSPLPERPDTAAVEAWLRRVRDHFYKPVAA